MRPKRSPSLPRRHVVAVVVLALGWVWAVTVPALAGGDLATVGESLRRDPVYVDADAERALDEAEVGELRARIRASGEPIFVAVLSTSFATTPAAADRLPIDVAEATGLSGTYAVVVGDRFRAASNAVDGADAAATAAFQRSSGDGTAAVLSDFVATVAGGRGGADAGSGSSDDGGDGGSSLPLLLLVGGGLGAYALVRRGRRRRAIEDERAWRADAELLRAELSVVGDDVLRLQPEVSLKPEAAADFDAAVERHRAASAALDAVDERVDLVRVRRVVDEARYAMSRVRALLDGRQPPAPPDELRQPGRHDEPPLEVDGLGRPVYAGGTAFYGGGGWFGGGGGLFSGLLIGSMLGGPFGLGGFGGGWGGGGGADGGGDGWTGGGGGWGGGGDWGGDVGGGDW